MNYRIGLDIGIGSVGWAVVSGEGNGHQARIEDFGTRIFDSGEDPQTSKSLCAERRKSRGVRRLERRKSYRKKLLKNHFQNIGMISDSFNDDYAACKDVDVYKLKLKALSEKLSSAELYKCLAHTCNHRGYRDFYEPDVDDEEAGQNASAANAFEKAFEASGKRTVSEYLLDEYYDHGFVKYRNRQESCSPHMLIRRRLFEDEARLILQKQSEYYPQLTQQNIDSAVRIVFNQRDFEDGPGDPNDKTRRYHGFLETLGQCPFYKEEKRGFRGTVISDVYAVTNTLSQYRFVDVSTGEYCLDKAVAAELVEFFLNNASLTMTNVKAILKAHGYKLLKGENSDDKALSKANKFLHIAKDAVEKAGYSWDELISEPQFDVYDPSLLHRIGELLSTYQTPKRRVAEMKKVGIPDALIKAFSEKKLNGTAKCSYHYMCDAIDAFLNGDIYGNFQATFIKECEETTSINRSVKLLPSHIDDAEVRGNPVVFKAINETRKIVNAIIDLYGSPEEIVIEVASELGKSLTERAKETNRQKANEKTNDKTKATIAELISEDVSKVTGAMIDRYRLFQEQDGKCLYSGKPLGDIKAVVLNNDRNFEIDHIVPYSLILDNTLSNKALVYSGENQKKGQRTPLMYLEGERREAFLKTVKQMYSRKDNPISKKKYAYLTLETIFGNEARELLDAWKSRNINDTRYITKYIAGMFSRYLVFTGEKAQHVFTVKGSITQKFRREWFRDSKWGANQKDRDNYLNHALDALVAANLTKPYIEIGSDSLRLISILKQNRGKKSPEYYDYLDSCIQKMKKYYGFGEEYTRSLLSHTDRVPSYVPRLTNEVSVRFDCETEEEFERKTALIYGMETPFRYPLQMPIVSHKQTKKFKGCIADDNPVRLTDIDGQLYKIKRVPVKAVSKKDMGKLYSEDKQLIKQLETIFEGKSDSYSVEQYLKDNSLESFITTGGVTVRKVSLVEKPASNYYRKEIGNGNYTYLGMPKYYCVEVYEDTKGKTQTCGVRFVDVVKRNGKLYRKACSKPENYGKHIMYLFTNDFVRIIDKSGNVKFEGFYKSVKTITRSSFYFVGKTKKQEVPNEANKPIGISQTDRVEKYDISILGKLGGRVKCSEPLPFIEESEYL